ncbi:response regulator transcription factor [Brooklawnia cerclae]
MLFVSTRTTVPARPIRVLVVDDDAMVRTGLRAILGHDPGLVVVGEASDGDEVLRAVQVHHPDAVLMDIRMERMHGIQAIARLQREVNPPKVIALTSFDLGRYVYEALDAGASGFLLKDTSPEDLRSAIRVVIQGNAILSPRSTRHVIEQFARSSDHERIAEAARSLASLSGREREIAELVHDNFSNAQISRRLGCSEATVKTHLSHIMAKLDATTRVQVAVLVERASGAH